MIRRIRTLQGVARNLCTIRRGTVLRIPEDLDEATALSWLKGGLAEEDKMIDIIPETKTAVINLEPSPEKPRRGRRRKCRT